MKLDNKILSKYKEIKYLNTTANAFDLQVYLNEKNLNIDADIDADTFISIIDKASEELKDYPTRRAKEMSTIIKLNYLNNETMMLDDIAKRLSLTYANAYKLRSKAIKIMNILTA